MFATPSNILISNLLHDQDNNKLVCPDHIISTDFLTRGCVDKTGIGNRLKTAGFIYFVFSDLNLILSHSLFCVTTFDNLSSVCYYRK
jgi:hypothetical protein